MDIFDKYDDDFSSLAQEVSSKISHAMTYEEDHESKLRTLRAAEDILSQAGDVIKQMEMEVRGEENESSKRDMQEKVAQFKKTLASLRRDLEETKREEEKAALFEDPTLEQRNRLMSANDRLERGSNRIRHALEITAETENTALDISEELNRNREKIETIHARVHAVSGLADGARRIVHSMSKREVQQKILLVLVAMILLGVVGLIIYLVVK